jgi:hypothetical protein
LTDLSGYAKKSTANGDTRSGLRLRLRLRIAVPDRAADADPPRHRDGVEEALALPSWIQPAVTVVAILLGALVAIAAAIGAAPNRHRIEI